MIKNIKGIDMKDQRTIEIVEACSKRNGYVALGIIAIVVYVLLLCWLGYFYFLGHSILDIERWGVEPFEYLFIMLGILGGWFFLIGIILFFINDGVKTIIEANKEYKEAKHGRRKKERSS